MLPPTRMGSVGGGASGRPPTTPPMTPPATPPSTPPGTPPSTPRSMPSSWISSTTSVGAVNCGVVGGGVTTGLGRSGARGAGGGGGGGGGLDKERLDRGGGLRQLPGRQERNHDHGDQNDDVYGNRNR